MKKIQKFVPEFVRSICGKSDCLPEDRSAIGCSADCDTESECAPDSSDESVFSNCCVGSENSSCGIPSPLTSETSEGLSPDHSAASLLAVKHAHLWNSGLSSDYSAASLERRSGCMQTLGEVIREIFNRSDELLIIKLR